MNVSMEIRLTMSEVAQAVSLFLEDTTTAPWMLWNELEGDVSAYVSKGKDRELVLTKTPKNEKSS